jgi:hypothetical protein
MVKHAMLPALSLASLFILAQPASAAETGARAPKSPAATAAVTASAPVQPAVPAKPQAAPANPTTKSDAKPAAKPASKPASKPALGDGIIAQNTLRIYLSRPATVTVHNARGQLLFHVDSSRPAEYLPLSGVDAGFLYLTFRSGPQETVRKLIYSGK